MSSIDLSEMTALVDCDSIVYAACAVGKDDEGNEVERFALANAKTMVKKILNRFETEDNYRLFLGGKDNYRKALARVAPYKGTRPPKPTFYDSVRSYLCDIWQAEIVDGMEAEDRLAIEYNKSPDDSVMVHIDKDILQVPGHHYSYTKEEYFYVTPAQANMYFWTQVLVGDQIDSITGVPGIGPKKAAELLKGVNTYRAGWNVCKDAYFDAFGKQRCERKDSKTGKTKKDGSLKSSWQYGPGEGLVCHDGRVLSWKEALVENCTLLWLLREEDKHFEALD